MARRQSSSSIRSANDGRMSPPLTNPSPNPNVFDDEYALDPDDHDHEYPHDFLPVADGFRPAAASDGVARHDHERSVSPRPSFSPRHSTDGDLRRMASRNSPMKAPFARESTPQDARHPGIHHTRGAASSSTGFSEGGVAPSHPYGMYTQVARSSSVTTSSTQAGPTHPYNMYPQNVVEVENEPPLAPVQAAIPVGFPGHTAGYRRQIGPDGEEQDIVGPDGHTEQLPPYTRYPVEGPTKAALAAEESTSPIATPVAAPAAARALPTPPAPTNVETESPTPPPADQPSPPRRQQTSDASSPTQLAPRQPTTVTVDALVATQSVLSEKPDPEKCDNAWRSKKVCGRIPRGVAIVILLLLLVFAVVLGAAIGTFVAKNKRRGDDHKPPFGEHHGKDEPSPQVTGTNSLFDATPIPTPTSIGYLPTGFFAVPLGIAQESSKNCLTDVNQLAAWSCKMSFAPLVLSINYTDNKPKASLAGLDKPDGSIQYGVQPPDLQMRSMQLVLDLDDRLYGPAYHFSALYDKVVVLNQDEFAASSGVSRAARKREDGGKSPFRHRFQVMPGENPWYCFWNQTYIEGYIYVESNSTAATYSNFPTAWPANPYGPSVPIETGAPMTATDSSVLSAPPTVPTPPPQFLARRGDGDYPRYAPYPRIVKIEDRRLPQSPQPYCQQMQLLEDGSVVEAVDNGNKPIRVDLQEDSPSMEEFLAPEPTPSTPPSKHRRTDLNERDDPTDACHCQWMFQ